MCRVHRDERLHEVASLGRQEGARQPAVARIGRPVPDHHRLGRPGGPRGVHDVAGLAVAGRRGKGGAVGVQQRRPVSVVPGGGEHPEPAGICGQSGPRLAGVGGRAGQDHGGLGMVQDSPQLGAGQPGVHGHRHRAGPVHRGIGDEPRERFVRADADDHPLPRGQTPLAQPPGQSVGVGVPGGEGQVGPIGQVAPGRRVRMVEGPGGYLVVPMAAQ